MRVDADLAIADAMNAVTGEMQLAHTIARDAVQELVRIESVIHRADVDVVHVQQQLAA